MKIEQIDGFCDLFEQRLKSGEKLSAEQFLKEHRLPPDAEILGELRKLETEYRNRNRNRPLPANPPPQPADFDRATTLMPGLGVDSTIGNYKLLQKIGEGGMGVVYMAEQSHPVSRRVALKIVKPGMDSKEVLARFEAERQALALMDHPNIARVLDAGTTSAGLPYFVMELVKGVPITAYCDEKQLSTKERLELFIPICQAVQHAHQKGVIHRDIKPTNVLVAQYDNRPVPKIIDFGLAKAIGQRLTEKTMFTQFGQIVGTIDYMSPEQASFNQLDVDTRSDIYSLGVLLYELLTGETPFDKKRLHSAAIDEMLRIIRQEEPPRPSVRLSSHAALPSTAAKRRVETKKLSLMIRGELDWIVMKAIDKERDRRYQTAGGFADDIHRYLTQETVLACPPSMSYQFQKFARRNRTLMTTAGVVFGALLLGLAGTSWALLRARTAEKGLAIQVGQLNHRSRHLSNELLLKIVLEEKLDEFDNTVSRWVDQQMAQISRDQRFDDPELQALQRDLLDGGVRFWDRVIATDMDSDGRPDMRSGDHRLQRALCLARAGKHQEAFAEVTALRDDHNGTSQWRVPLIRICALCATSAGSDSRLSDAYVETGMQILKETASEPDAPPPSPEIPDLVPLAAQQDFAALLKEWEENWSRRVEMQSQNLRSF